MLANHEVTNMSEAISINDSPSIIIKSYINYLK